MNRSKLDRLILGIWKRLILAFRLSKYQYNGSWEKELYLTVPNCFGIRIISLQISIIVELKLLASYINPKMFPKITTE